MGKVDRKRCEILALDIEADDLPYRQIVRAIEQAVREQTDWLMGEVCIHCGRTKIEHPLPDFDDGSCPCNKHGWYVVDLSARAEYLRWKGEKP